MPINEMIDILEGSAGYTWNKMEDQVSTFNHKEAKNLLITNHGWIRFFLSRRLFFHQNVEGSNTTAQAYEKQNVCLLDGMKHL